MKKLLAIIILLSVSTSLLYAQNKTIKGKVIDDNLEILPGVSIMINDTVKVGNTDLNGFFKIDIPAPVKKISLGFIGFEPTTIELADECNEVEVVMLSAAHYDFITLKKADKLRRKDFEKLPQLHKKAFENGLFKTDKPCYTQKFRPYYKKNKREAATE